MKRVRKIETLASKLGGGVHVSPALDFHVFQHAEAVFELTHGPRVFESNHNPVALPIRFNFAAGRNTEFKPNRMRDHDLTFCRYR